MSTMETLLDDMEAAAKRMREIYEKWESLREAQQAYIEDLESRCDALQARVDNALAVEDKCPDAAFYVIVGHMRAALLKVSG